MMPTTTPPKVSVRMLTKRYGPVAAVRNVSFDVAAGEIFGLLGPNGAGKTTAIECILGLRSPDSGSITIEGIDALAHPGLARRRVGAQIQSAALQDKITPRQALGLFASFYRGPARPEGLIERFELAHKADEPFDSLSGGQRQRLFLALAFVSDPALVVLDEPTAGLDSRARRELHRLIAEARTAGKTILLTTHIMEEAHALCDRVAILHEGRIVALEEPDALIAGSNARISFRTSKPIETRTLVSLPHVVGCKVKDAGWVLVSSDPNRTIVGLVKLVEAGANELLDLQIHRPSLEDVFLELTGRTLPAAEDGPRPAAP
jgi:ABC-2 type transport system ATP-binding protein